jgi:C4-dicarboxylate-specific signal transduction histidine kinase
MTATATIQRIIEAGYEGRILKGPYSEGLKRRVAALILVHRAFDRSSNPSMTYIAAWEALDTIWYEFAGRRFCRLFGESLPHLAPSVRRRIVDQRIYRHVSPAAGIQEEVRDQAELRGARGRLRERGRTRGLIEAVYKVRTAAGDTWLKDQAAIETHDDARVCIAVGNLTDVTKEMRAEEERLQRERLEVSLQMAGAVCHELNQPIQGISGYAETLLRELPEGHAVRGRVARIMDLTERMAVITGKLTKITRYATKDYLKGIKIIDLDEASE